MRKAEPKTVKRNKRITEAVRKGTLNYSSAARKYGLSRQYVQQLCKDAGVESPYKQKPAKKTRTKDEYMQERKDAALEHAKKVEKHYNDDEPLDKLAKRFGVTEATMRNFVSRWRNKVPGMFTKRKGE